MAVAPEPQMSGSLRQWVPIAIAGLALALLIGSGWLVRDRFTPVEVGSRAPNFTAVDLHGRSVSLSDLRGEVVFLNIWATWCPPCREEMPSMQRLHEELAQEGLRIVAVSIDAARGKTDPIGRAGGDLQRFTDEYGLTFDIWHDPSGEIQRIYRTTGVPESLVIDRAGVIVKKVIGATDWDSEANIAMFRRLLSD